MANNVAAKAMALAATTRAFSIFHLIAVDKGPPQGFDPFEVSVSWRAGLVQCRNYGQQFDERMKWRGARNGSVRKMARTR
jgi:hypothetical protein